MLDESGGKPPTETPSSETTTDVDLLQRVVRLESTVRHIEERLYRVDTILNLSVVDRLRQLEAWAANRPAGRVDR